MSSMTSVDTVMKPGHWGLFDATSDHYRYGQGTISSIWSEGNSARSFREKIARYFVVADEVEWNYAPEGENMRSNSKFTEEENVWMANGDHRIGAKYIKAAYREYKDANLILRFGAESDSTGLSTLGASRPSHQSFGG